MLKVTAFAHTSVIEEAVERLRSVGVVDVTADANDLPAPLGEADEERLHAFDEYIADAQFIVSFLGRYHTSDAPFAQFVSEKFHLSAEEFEALEPDAHFRETYRACVDVSDLLASMARHRDAACAARDGSHTVAGPCGSRSTGCAAPSTSRS